MPQKVALPLAVMLMLGGYSRTACAQKRPQSAGDVLLQQARSNTGIMAGNWHVPAPTTTGAAYSNTLSFGGFTQRGLNAHVGLESSAALWRRVSTREQPAGRPIVTKSYLIPLITSLKVYPVTTAARTVEPYLLGGIGFSLGIQHQSTNAIGGGGTDVVTGFGMKIGIGAEYHATKRLGAFASWRYLWLNFSDRISDQQAFAGRGLEGGLNYKFTL